jgi:3'-5' exoribonuclease 1
MQYIIVDLEATCWRDMQDRERMEIIEIGAVRLPSGPGPAGDEFQRFVRPVQEPVLSDFCRELTSITQPDVDAAATFPSVFGELVEWIGPLPFTLCSWGAYDLNQFRLDCRRHAIELPATFERHINLKAEFARKFKVRPPGMSAALKIAGMGLEGTHHRGIDDARNIARLARLVLPEGSIGAGEDDEG